MAENMLSAESRISDADIGAEMMVFVKNQIFNPVQRGHAQPGKLLAAYADEFDWG